MDVDTGGVTPGDLRMWYAGSLIKSPRNGKPELVVSLSEQRAQCVQLSATYNIHSGDPLFRKYMDPATYAHLPLGWLSDRHRGVYYLAYPDSPRTRYAKGALLTAYVLIRPSAEFWGSGFGQVGGDKALLRLVRRVGRATHRGPAHLTKEQSMVVSAQTAVLAIPGGNSPDSEYTHDIMYHKLRVGQLNCHTKKHNLVGRAVNLLKGTAYYAGQ